MYTGGADEGSANAIEAIGDSDLGGTVATNLKGVTFTAAAGTLTPSNTRPHLMFATLYATINTNSRRDRECQVSRTRRLHQTYYKRWDSFFNF